MHARVCVYYARAYEHVCSLYACASVCSHILDKFAPKLVEPFLCMGYMLYSCAFTCAQYVYAWTHASRLDGKILQSACTACFLPYMRTLCVHYTHVWTVWHACVRSYILGRFHFKLGKNIGNLPSPRRASNSNLQIITAPVFCCTGRRAPKLTTQVYLFVSVFSTALMARSFCPIIWCYLMSTLKNQVIPSERVGYRTLYPPHLSGRPKINAILWTVR
jgi:hypothetical protein